MRPPVRLQLQLQRNVLASTIEAQTGLIYPLLCVWILDSLHVNIAFVEASHNTHRHNSCVFPNIITGFRVFRELDRFSQNTSKVTVLLDLVSNHAQEALSQHKIFGNIEKQNNGK